MVLPPRRLAERIDQPVLFVGNGIAPYRSLLSAALGRTALFASSRFQHPRAAVVGRLGLDRFIRGQSVALETLEPIYVRPSEAELKRRQRDLS
jgi:tRNA threonylcarbamoyladenosine biosynthesis protein TsaB